MRRLPWLTLLALVAVCVLWRGGKSLDAVWLLTLGVSALVIFTFVIEFFREENRRAHPVAWSTWIGTLLFLLWTVLSFIYSSTDNYGFDEVLRTVSYGLLFLWVASRAESVVSRNQTARVLAVVTLVACAVGIAIYVLQPVNRFVGTFFDYRFHTDYWPNAWAEYLLLAWPLCAWSLFRGNEATAKNSLLLKSSILGFVLGCLLLSYSRGGFIAFAGQAILAFCAVGWAYRNTAFPWKKFLTGALATVVTAVLCFIAVNSLRSRFHEVESVTRKVTFTADEGGSSVSERSQFWKQAIDLGKQRPVFGWGPYSFRFTAPHSQRSVLAASDHPHNVFLKLFAERGIVAAILFALFVCIVLWKGMRSFFVSRVDSERLLTLAMVCAFAGVIAHNLIDYNLQFVGIALPLTILAGFLVGSTGTSIFAYRAQSMFGLVIIVVLLATTAKESRAQYWSTLGRHTLHETSTEGRERAMTYFSKAENSLFSRDSFITTATIALSLKEFDRAKGELQKYIALNPEDARVWYLLGDTEMSLKHPNEAAAAYIRAYEYGRYNDLSIVRGLLQAWRATGDRQIIESHKADVVDLLNDFAVAIERNLHFVALSKNVEELQQTAGILAQLYPAESDGYRLLIDHVESVALRERSKIVARPQGFLWKPSHR